MIAKYIRLSSQDDDCAPGEKSESNSVANQRALLNHYIAAHPEFAGKSVLEFVDDGHTGTNFDRPGVQALFSGIKRGEIDCVIVKDLSRFGRTSSETCDYLERIFPALQVRFITVNDGYDSNARQYGAAGDLDIGVRSIMNELYSRKVSQDVKTAKRQCAARGECIAAYPIYGYVKGSTDRRRLEVDPPAAEIVRLVFSLWLEGNSIDNIAATLNNRQIPSPSARKRELGAKRTSWSRLREDIPWTKQAVRVMLRNERYTGKLISLRTVREELGNPNQRAVPKEDWIVVENAFEPIIDKDTFQKAQVLFRALPPRPKRVQAQHSKPLFSRKIVCGICGQGLMRQKSRRIYYRCAEKHGPLANQCKVIRIYEDDLMEAVRLELQGRAAAPANTTHETSPRENPESLQTQITSLEQQIEKKWSAKKDAFVKWDSGMISKTAYEDICAEKRQEIQRLGQDLERLKTLLACGWSAEDEYQEQLADAGGGVKLTQEIVDALIQTVRVFDAGRVEVEWKPQNRFDAVSAAFTEGVPRLM